MQKTERLMGALGMCRKAGKLTMGFDAAVESVMKGKSYLVLLTSDLSPRTEHRAREACEGLVPCLSMPLSQTDLLGVAPKPTGVFSVLDENFAKLCEKHLDYKEEYIE